MDIKDGFATSSKEHLRSLLRVHELDEITSCEENLHLGREDDILKIMQVEGAKCIIS
jgi:hypothetical protein